MTTSPQEQERAAIVAWLDNWALVSGGGNKDYNAGWSMACFNAAREIERGDHLNTPATTIKDQ